jgi:exopolyphosphatase/pppGpp-phosphohydrolase
MKPTTHRDGVPLVGAAVDVGSNSVHLLVAALNGRDLHTLHDESHLLGLGDGVDRDGLLSDVAVEQLGATLRRYVALARSAGAKRTTLLASEPFRRAANGRAVAAALAREVGLPLHVLTHEAEGLLALLAVTGGSAPPDEWLVVDIGGGSTEWVVARPDAAPLAAALPIGSARLSALTPSDPPAQAELDDVRSRARDYLAGVPDAAPVRAVFTGGTATNLARLAADGTQRMTRGSLQRAYERLTAEPAVVLAAASGVNLRRLRQLAAGAAIVEAFLERFALDGADVSTVSPREGAILAAAAAGDAWPDALPALARGGDAKD